jgi:hypothetical protein
MVEHFVYCCACTVFRRILFASSIAALTGPSSACTSSPTGPNVPSTVQLQAGDIVYRRVANGQTSIGMFIGTGNYLD